MGAMERGSPAGRRLELISSQTFGTCSGRAAQSFTTPAETFRLTRGFTTVSAARRIRNSTAIVGINVARVGKKTHGSLRIQFGLEYHADTSTVTDVGVRWSRSPSTGLGEHCFC